MNWRQVSKVSFVLTATPHHLHYHRLPSLWEKCLPQNQSLMPKRLETSVLNDNPPPHKTMPTIPWKIHGTPKVQTNILSAVWTLKSTRSGMEPWRYPPPPPSLSLLLPWMSLLPASLIQKNDTNNTYLAILLWDWEIIIDKCLSIQGTKKKKKKIGNGTCHGRSENVSFLSFPQ